MAGSFGFLSAFCCGECVLRLWLFGDLVWFLPALFFPLFLVLELWGLLVLPCLVVFLLLVWQCFLLLVLSFLFVGGGIGAVLHAFWSCLAGGFLLGCGFSLLVALLGLVD